jgi:zinc protease
MIKKLTFLLALLSLLALPIGAVSAANPDTEKTLDFNDYMLDIEDFTLPNGLRVILAEDHSAPVVAVNLWYRVGGANDPAERSGFAHLFEHMMFEGSDNIGNDEFHALLEQIGASNNAYTANDNTAYWAVAPANELPRVLWMESDRMASLDVNQEAFETQRDVVIEEYNQRVANAPYGASNRRLFTQAMQGYVPYERTVIGSVEDLEAASLAEVREFHDTFYKPNNATLVIVGDIDVELTKTLVQSYFGDIPAGDIVVPITDQYPAPEEYPVLRTDEVTGCSIGYEETYIDPLVELPRYAATVVGPPRGDADFYALDLLSDILSGGDSSRYEQNIIRQGEAAAAFTGMSDYLGGSILYTIGYPNSGDSTEQMEALLRAEFASVIEEGIAPEELERVKTQKLVGSVTAFRESARSTSEWLQDAVLTFDDPTAIAEELTQYEAVTPEDIQRVAEEYLCKRPLNTLITLPEGEAVLAEYPGLLVEPVEVELVQDTTVATAPTSLSDNMLEELPEGVISRETVPSPLPIGETSLPPFKIFTVDNGLEVIFVEQNEVPKLNLSLYVGGSNAAISADKQGVPDFMAELLTKGTETLSSTAIAEMIESVGGDVSASAGLEWTNLSANALSTDSDLAFDLLADMALNPIFPMDEMEVIREQTLTFLEQNEVEPDTLANRQFGRLAYGGHPYGYYMNQETVDAITRDDVVAFHETYYKPNNALLVVVGDITLDQAEESVARVFGEWESGDVPDYLDYPTAELGDTSVIYLIDRPDSQQATIQVGNRAINARTPERYALTVVNSVLGSGASSRLFDNLREDKGYTYGVYSRFGRPNDTSTFRVLTDVDQEHTADAIQEILFELEDIRTNEISESELADAKGLLIGNFALAIEDPADFARQLSTRYLTGLPIDELNNYLPEIEDVTALEAKNAAAKYIDSEQPIIVVVGNADVVQEQLEELAPVVVVDADGNVVEE